MVGMEEFEKVVKEKVDVSAMNEILEDRLGEEWRRDRMEMKRVEGAKKGVKRRRKEVERVGVGRRRQREFKLQC